MKAKEWSHKITNYLISGKRRKWVRIMACVVIFCTTYALILPAITMEKSNKVLACDLNVHTHTADCYDEESNLVCGKADFVVHKHNSDCYDKDNELICELKEVETHTHSSECYKVEQVLACGKEESDEHTHGEDCYEENKILICGKDEIILHTHSESCYDETGNLSCGKTEVKEHVHADDCFVEAETEEETTEAVEEKAETKETSKEESTDETAKETTEAEDKAKEAEATKADETTEAAEETTAASSKKSAKKAAAKAKSAVTDPTLPNCQAIYDVMCGETTTPYIQSGKVVYYRFTPAETVEYIFTSDVTPENSGDTFGYLYNSSGTLIISNDDKASGVRAFYISKVLQAGQTYYLGAGYYSTGYGSYKFSLSHSGPHSFTDGICTICGFDLSTLKGTCGASGNEDSVTWYVDENLVLHIEGTGDMYDDDYPPWYSVNSNVIQGVEISSGITSIGKSAFSGCTSLTSIDIPDTVTSIGSNAFNCCTSLKSAELPDGLTAIPSRLFYNCSSLASCEIPESVTSIGTYAFYGCTLITELNIPENVTSIGANAFQNCTKLKEITISSGVKAINSATFYGCTALTKVEIPESVTSIGASAFYGCTSLKSVTLPGGITTIPSQLFYNCSSLTSCEIPEGVTSIGYNAFYGCSSLTSVTIPETVTSIGTQVFYNCSSLKSVVLPSKITTIGSNMFYGCSALKSINVPEKVTTIDNYAFYGCTSLGSIEIPSSVKKIGNYAFYNCKALTEVELPESITIIDTSAFSGCSKLTKINIPKNITTIADSIFYNCSSLTEIEIPEKVTTIGSNSFYNNKKLTKITFDSAEIITCISNSFSGCKNIEKVVFTDNLETLSYAVAYALAASGSSNIDFDFEGPNTFTYTGKDVTVSNAVFTAGTYYADGTGAVYLLDEDNSTATLVTYSKEKATSIEIPESITVGLKHYDVTSIGQRAFLGCTNLESITLSEGLLTIGNNAFKGCTKLASVVLPESVASLGTSAFANCTALADVNGYTTYSEVRVAFASKGVNQTTFANTALWENRGDVFQVTTEPLEINKEDSDDNHYRLTVTTTAQSKYYTDETFHLLTGENAQLEINLSNIIGTVTDDLRVYFQFDNGNPSSDSNKLFGYELEKPLTFTSSDGKTVTGTFHATDTTGYYYLELTDVFAGDTMNLNLSIGYQNYTEGGTMMVWLDSEGTGKPDKMTVVKWDTVADSFPITKSSLNATSITLYGDGTEDGLTTLRNLAYTVSINHPKTESSYGKDILKSIDFVDTLTLPEHFYWRDGVLDAIKDNDWYCESSNNKYTFYVRLHENGKTVNVQIASVYCNSYISTISLANPSLDVVDGKIQIGWTYTNSQTTTQISTNSFTITYGSYAIVADTEYIEQTLIGTEQNVVFDFPNEVKSTENFTYSGTVEQDTSVNTRFSVGQSSFSINKSSSTYSASMGSSQTFTITLSNTTSLPFVSLNYVKDPLSECYYITPGNMEKMFFEDTYGSLLDITINSATLCEPKEQTVTGTDGQEYTINQTITGTQTSYSGKETVDDCAVTTDAVIKIGWAEDNTNLKITVTYGETSNEYIIGSGGDYETIEACFNAIGFIVTKDAAYTCQWDQTGKTLYSGQTRTFYVRASAKSTFMRLIGDQDWYITSGTTYGSFIYNYAYAYYTGATGVQSYKSSYTYNSINRDFKLTKYAYLNGKRADETSEIVAGDVLTYSNNVTYSGTVSYDALPMADRMQGGQVLLVKVSDNPSLADEDLPTMAVDNDDYYILNKVGTYTNIKVGNYLADKVEVKKTSSGIDVMIYWYLNVYSSTSSISVTYKALISPTYAGIEESDTGEIAYPLKNEVWLGDHETHRLYDDTFLNGSILKMNKNIVTNAEDEITSEHDYTADTLVKHSTVKKGERVTYRLMLQALGDESTVISGKYIYDTLPGSMNNYWSKENVKISYVVTNGSQLNEITDESSDGWYITQGELGTLGKTQQYIRWNDDFKIDLKGTLYIYVTVDFQNDPDESQWDHYCEAYETELRNTWNVYQLSDDVSHDMFVEAEVYLQKGVYATGTSSSAKAYTIGSASDNRLFYTNDTYTNGIVTYYVTVANNGPTRIYLTNIQDVLPKGFTFYSLYYNTTYLYYSSSSNMTSYSNSKYYNSLVDIDNGGTKTLTYKTAQINVTTATTESGNQRVTFALSNGSSGNLSYDSDRQMYYLRPSQAVVIAYNCRTNLYDDSEDSANNIVTMPYYSYNGAGVKLAEGYSATIKTTGGKQVNDGSCALTSNGQAALWGMNTAGCDNSTDWIYSNVTVYRGNIVPGIQKAATVSQATTTETITWNITASNDGSDAIRDYTLTDIMMTPYQFTGTVEYTLYDSGGSSVGSATLFTFNNSSGKDLRSHLDSSVKIYSETNKKTYTLTVGGSAVEFSTSIGDIEVRLSRDESSNEVLNIMFKDERYAAIPAGGKGVLSLSTLNYSGVNENKIFVNDCYITPNLQTFNNSTVSKGSCTPYDATNDDLYNPLPSVESEAQVPVSYGYSTSAEKAITEIDSNLAKTSNTTTSNSATNYIVLSDKQKMFRYDLKVSNSGGVNATALDMNLFVLVDNLPEVNDHTTFYAQYPRYSEFDVCFVDAEKLDPAVKIEYNGTTNVLDASQYEIKFSKQTEFDYDDGDNSKIWNGNALTTQDGWYTIDELEAAGLSLEEMRSFRIVIEDPDAAARLMPASSTITISFNAKISSDSNPTYSQIAWNSFGYLYRVNKNTLRAAPLKVGVKTPGIPYLKKTLSFDDNVAYQAPSNTAFNFIIYENSALTFASNATPSEIAATLSERNIPFTVATITVDKDSSASDEVPLEGLKVYSYDSSTQSYSATDADWEWKNNQTYCIYELNDKDDYYFGSFDSSRGNNYAFTYSQKSSVLLTANNIRKAWTIQVVKTDDYQTAYLPGAVFGLYSKVEADAMTQEQFDEFKATLETEPRQRLSIDGTMWYLTDIQTTGENGFIKWEHMMESSYYLLEIQAPEGYLLSEQPGRVISSETCTGTVNASVINISTYSLPKTGGSGTYLYTLSGMLLVAGCIACGYIMKRRERRRN